jgi:hypothetical protein
MNSLNTTASGRADVRFQDIQAAGRDIVRSALNRSRLLLLLLLLAAPQAMAATAASCQDGAKVAVDGTIKTVNHYDTGTWLFIDAPSWDCGPITILAKDAGACVLGSTIHAEGTLSKPGINDLYEGWKLSNVTAGDGAKYISSFSCR